MPAVIFEETCPIMNRLIDQHFICYYEIRHHQR